MGDVVDLQGQPVHLEDNHEFVTDCARYGENLLTEAAIKKKYRFDDATWASLGDNDALVEAIEAEKIRRVRTGAAKRERAQLLVVQAPDIMSSIMLDTNTSPRHRIDSAKALDAFAANVPEGAPASERFQIVINLGADTLRFDKARAIDANDVDPHNVDPTPPVVAAIAANKPGDGDDGEPV